ncbi:MAG: filamentous hemagglutinin N-terminal domain-containing protein [Pseudomonadota bacterium]
MPTANHPLRRKLLPVLLLAAFSAAEANPNAPVVVNGSATFNQQGNVFSITNTPNTIINWQSFNINEGEITRFIQQNADSSVLNRILGQDPSKILGALQSNGHVFLINPNGILFGRDSRVDVGGLVASTLNLSNGDFLAGRKNFAAGPVAGNISNAGAINSAAGSHVFLIASNVENSGVITSPQGQVILAAGHTVQLVDSRDPNMHVVVSAPDSAALNLGHVIAQGGKIGIYGALVTQRGRVSADSAVVGENGKIVFKASRDTMLEQGSVTSATGAGTGGEVQVLGERVALAGNASIDASGQLGGGTVLVGGDYQGKNGAVHNAQMSVLDRDASIKVDALASGNGGKAIVWADDTSLVYGSISARGGLAGGDGGTVETSGKKTLSMIGARVDAGAAKGRAGSWLLDPYNVNITTGTTGGAFAGGGTSIFTPTAVSSTADATTIVGALNGGTNVNITTTGAGAQAGDITVSSALSWNTYPSILSLVADGAIAINNTVTSTGGGTLKLNSGASITQTAAITVPNVSAVAAGAVTLTNTGNNIGTIAGSAAGGTGFQFVTSTDTATGTVGGVVGVSTTNNKAISLTSSTGVMTVGDAVSGGGAIALSGDSVMVSGGNVTSTGGNVSLTATGSNVVTSSVSVDGGDVTASGANGTITLDSDKSTVDVFSGSTVTASQLIVKSNKGASGDLIHVGALNVHNKNSGDITFNNTGQDLTLNAVTGNSSALIQDGTGNITVTTDSAHALTVSAAVATVGGDISLSSGTATAVGANISGANITLEAGTGGVSGGIAVNAGTLSATTALKLLADKGDLTQSATTSSLSASTLYAEATLGLVDLSGVNTGATTVSGYAGTGMFRYSQANSFTIDDVSGNYKGIVTNGQAISLASLAGDITLTDTTNGICANGPVTMPSACSTSSGANASVNLYAGGAIVSGNVGALVTGSALNIFSATGIGATSSLHTQVDTVGFHDTTSGNINIVNYSSTVRPLSLDGLDNRGSGSVVINNRGNVTVDNNLAYSEGGGLTLSSSGGNVSVVSGAINTINGGPINLYANGAISIARAVASDGGPVALSATNGAISQSAAISGDKLIAAAPNSTVTLTAANDVATLAGVSSGAFQFTNSGAFNVDFINIGDGFHGVLSTGAGAITLTTTAGGINIVDANTGVKSTGGSVQLSATGTGGSVTNSNGSNGVTASSLKISAATGIYGSSAANPFVANVASVNLGNSGSGAINFSSPQNLTIADIGSAGYGARQLFASQPITISASATKTLTVGAAVQSSLGAVTLAGPAGVTLSGQGSVASAGGAVAISASEGGATLTTAALGNTINSANGPVALTADHMDLTGTINAGIAPVVLAPSTQPTDVIVGANATGTVNGALSLSDVELRKITAGSLEIDASVGAGLSVNGALDLLSGGTLAGPLVLNGPTGVTVSAALSAPQLMLGTSGGDITNSAAIQTASVGGTVAINAATGMFTNNSTISANGPITIIANKMSLNGAGTQITSTASLVALAPFTGSKTISLGAGAADTNGTLGLTDAELKTINPGGELLIGAGAAQTGAISVDGALNLASSGLTSSDTLRLWANSANPMALNGAVTVPGTLVLMNGAGAVTQTAQLSANALKVAGGSVVLGSSNSVGTLAGLSNGAFTFRSNATTDLAIGSVDSTSGITSNGGGAITLTTNGRITQDNSNRIYSLGGSLVLETGGAVALANPTNVFGHLAASLNQGGSNRGASTIVDAGSMSVEQLSGNLGSVNGIDSNAYDLQLVAGNGATAGGITTIAPITVGSAKLTLAADMMSFGAAGTVTAATALMAPTSSSGRAITIGAASCDAAEPSCLLINHLDRVHATNIGIGTRYDALHTDALPLAGHIYVGGITNGGGTSTTDRYSGTTLIGLGSGSGITQTGQIIVNQLGISAGGPVVLTNGANSIAQFAAETNNASLSLTDARALDVTALTIAGGNLANSNQISLAGINSHGGNVTLHTGAGSTDKLSILSKIDAGSGSVNLASTGAIYGGTGVLDVVAGVADLSAAGLSPDAGTLAIDGVSGLLTQVPRIHTVQATAGSIKLRSQGGLTLGPAAPANETDVQGVGSIDIATPPGYALTLNGNVSAAGAYVSLSGPAGVAINGRIDAAGGKVALLATTGNISQSASTSPSAAIVADALAAVASAGSVTLNNTGNAVSHLAGQANAGTGFTYIGSSGFDVASVALGNTYHGVVANNGAPVTLTANAGGIDVTDNQAGAGLRTSGNIVLNAAAGAVRNSTGTVTGGTLKITANNGIYGTTPAAPFQAYAGSVNLSNNGVGAINFAGMQSFSIDAISSSYGARQASTGETIRIVAAPTFTLGVSAPISTQNGAITLLADDMNLQSTVASGNGASGLQPITLAPSSSGTNINIGAFALGHVAGTLSLTNTELANLNASMLTLDAGSGALAVNGPVNVEPTLGGPLAVNASGGITVNGTLAASSLSMQSNGAAISINAGGGVGAVGTGGTLAINAGSGTFTNSGSASALGPVSIVANAMALGGSSNAISSTQDAVTLSPFTASNAIVLGAGAADTAGTLGLTDAELRTVNPATTLVIGGSSQSGAITVGGALDLSTGGLSSSEVFKLNAGAGANVTLNGALTAPGTVVINSGAGAITQSAAGVIGAANLAAIGGSVVLDQQNGVGNIAGASATNFAFRSNNAQGIVLSTVDGNSGISAGVGGTISLNSAAGISQGGGLNQLFASNGNVVLEAVGPAVLANPGNVFSNLSAALNQGGAGVKGASTIVDSSDLTVQAQTGISGATINGIDNNGQVLNLSAIGSAASRTLTSLAPVTVGTSRLNLVADNISVAPASTLTAGSVLLSPATSARAITVGAPACDSGAPNCLLINHLDRVHAPTIGIGSTYAAGGAGPIFVAGISNTQSGAVADRWSGTTLIGLGSTGAITQSAPINVNALGVSAGGAVVLTDPANQVGTLAAETNGSDFSFANAQALSVGTLGAAKLLSGASPALSGITTNGGNVTLAVNGAPTNELEILAAIDVGTTANVTLNSHGAIYGGTGVLDIRAGTAALTGSGQSSRNSSTGAIDGVDGLHTEVTRISSLSAPASGINLVNTGALTLGPVIAAAVTAVSANGVATIAAHSPITINGDISAGGALTLTAGAAASPDNADVVTFNRPVSSGGAITVNANRVAGAFVPAGAGVTLNLSGGTITFEQCLVHPTLSGCDALLPSMSQCINDPTVTGCDARLPTLAQCIANKNLTGCSVRLPTFDSCLADKTQPGCEVRLPTLTQCIADKTIAGCEVRLPTLSQCVASPTMAGCEVRLPTLTQCIADKTLPGCDVRLPTIAQCTADTTLPGCDARLPTLNQCIATPALPGCDVRLPSITQCVASPTLPGCDARLPSLNQCIATPTLPGCDVRLPSITQCIAAPTLPGCSARFPAIGQCIADKTLPGCDVVLPTLNQCIATPTLTGCEARLPSITQCIADKTLPGCGARLPTFDQCVANKALPGCDQLLPTLNQCIANKALPGCDARLPTLNQCIADKTLPGCDVRLPTITQCIATPTLPGCGVRLPTIDQCVADKTRAGCDIVLPTTNQCIATPTLPGCDARLPTITQCVADKTQPGCDVRLPTLTQCIATPTAPGCEVRLPTFNQCVADKTLPGCDTRLPTITQCVADKTLPGCDTRLPTLTQCVTDKTLPGCEARLPTLTQCVADKTLPGCDTRLPTLTQCVTDKTLPGCEVRLPTISQCIADKTLTGCDARLPTLNQCVADPSLTGCDARLPTLTQCVTNKTLPGCDVRLPTLDQCVSTPTLPGCSARLPKISECIAAPTAPGCSAVLPTLRQCTDSPTLDGCSVILPPVNVCLSNPTAEGCQVVLPPTNTQSTLFTPLNQALNNTVNIINTVTTTSNGHSLVIGGGTGLLVTGGGSSSTSTSSTSGTTGSGTTGGSNSTPDTSTGKKNDKADGKSSVNGTDKSTGAKNDEPVRKLYCN